MNARAILMALCAMLLVTSGVWAQRETPELPTQAPISVGQVVEDTITDAAIFDLWTFSALKGDRLRAVMVASEGLAPLIGVRTGGGEIFARSDANEDGTLNSVTPNSTAVLEFTIPEDGEYFFVATRADLDNGTSSGRYTLSFAFVDDSVPAPRENLLQPVTFRCGEDIATTAATLAFDEDRQTMSIVRISIYGIDGFQPVLQLDRDELATCLEPQAELTPQTGALALPDGETVEVSQLNIAVYLIEAARPVYLTLGTRGELTGRYIILIEGFAIDEAEDRDALFVRLGPRAVDSTLSVYMLNGGQSRIDPMIEVLREDSTTPQANCDDAGRFACADVPAADALKLTVDENTISGGRLDAGVILAPADDAPTALIFSSSNTANGSYLIWLLGGITQVNSR